MPDQKDLQKPLSQFPTNRPMEYDNPHNAKVLLARPEGLEPPTL